MSKELFLIRGVQGAGKSSVAKRLSSNICEIDQFWYHRKKADGTVERNVEGGEYIFDPSLVHLASQFCLDRCEMFMRNRRERVVVANTFSTTKELKPYYELAEKYDYMTFSIIVENRHGGTNVHDVSEDIVNRLKRRFEVKL